MFRDENISIIYNFITLRYHIFFSNRFIFIKKIHKKIFMHTFITLEFIFMIYFLYCVLFFSKNKNINSAVQKNLLRNIHLYFQLIHFKTH